MTEHNVPDPSLDDDPRVRAAVHAYAARELAGVQFEPIAPMALPRTRRRWTLVAAAVAIVVCTASGVALLQLRAGTPIPGATATPTAPVSASADPTASASPTRPVPLAGLDSCLASLTPDSIDAGTPSLGEPQIVGYGLVRYTWSPGTQISLAGGDKGFPQQLLQVDDLSTGESADVTDSGLIAVFSSSLTGLGQARFADPVALSQLLNDNGLSPKSTSDSTVITGPGGFQTTLDRTKPSAVIAVVIQYPKATLAASLACGSYVHEVQVTGFVQNSASASDQPALVAVECGTTPEGRTAELTEFAQTCAAKMPR